MAGVRAYFTGLTTPRRTVRLQRAPCSAVAMLRDPWVSSSSGIAVLISRLENICHSRSAAMSPDNAESVSFYRVVLKCVYFYGWRWTIKTPNLKSEVPIGEFRVKSETPFRQFLQKNC